MTLKSDLEANATTLQSGLDALNANIALVGLPENPVLELRPSTCPSSITVNYYPYEIQYYEGFLYVSTIGGNAGGSGNASFFKINPKNGAIVGTYVAGSSASGHGLLGFCIVDGKAYVVHNFGTAQIDVIDLDTMSKLSSVPLGSGVARNCVSDGINIYIATTDLALKKFDIATQTVSTIYTFGANTEPFRIAYFNNKLWVCLFGAVGNSVEVIETNGTYVKSISTGAGSKPNWFGQTESRLFVSCYGTHKAYEITTGFLGMAYNCPTADYPHIPFPVMGKQLWLGGTAGTPSYIRVFDINTGALITSLAKGPNIPSMAFDGGNVWNISANGNYIQRTVLDLVNE